MCSLGLSINLLVISREGKMETGMETTIVLIKHYGYLRGLNNYQYHFELHLSYHILELCKEYGTTMLVII